MNHGSGLVEWRRHSRSLSSVLEAIGRTPMVCLTDLDSGSDAVLFMKLEWYGPSGSLKDRIYLHMFEEAERNGDLDSSTTVLECSTGNAGAACACIAAAKGYKCKIVMPAGMSEERKSLMRAYGADLVFTPGAESDVDLSLRKVREILESDPERYWVPAQFDNPANVDAHYRTTGPEIWEQCEGRIDALVASQGSGGFLTGAGRFLRERNPSVLLYAVEPSECPILSHRTWGTHGIEGIGDGFVPRNLDVEILTGVITVDTAESVNMARLLARRQGIFCGISSGCNVAAARKLVGVHPELEYVVVLANDTGQRYFSTSLCGETKQVDVPLRDHPLDDRSRDLLDRFQGSLEIIE